MRSVPAVLVAALLIACGSGSEPAPEAPSPTVADFAGMWQNTANLNGVPDPVPSTFSGSAAGDDWTMTLEGRPPVPMQVSIVGDSLVAQSAEYESVLRPGVMVTVRTASVLDNGMLRGNLAATYRSDAGDEVVTGTITGTRVQN